MKKYLNICFSGILSVALLLNTTPITSLAATTDAGDGEFYIDDITVTTEESYADLFPGLSHTYTMTPEQLEAKEILAEHADSIVAMDSLEIGTFEEGQVVYLTEDRYDAELVADAFGGTLDSFAYDVAVINLPAEASVTQAVCAAADSEIALPAVWPNYYKELHDYSDPFLYESSSRYQWHHEAVGDKYAWEQGYLGEGIKVAVLDTGIRNSHEEFDGRLVQHLNMVNSTTDGEDSYADNNGHGSHVSGIIAANLDNGKGGSGIAPKASLYVYDVTSNAQGSISAAAEYRAVNRAIEDGVNIINMSFGSGSYDGNEYQVMQNAYQAGIALFASAGNSSTNGTSYPASYENVCSIAAANEDGTLSYFSNYNAAVDFIFPGNNIYSVHNSENSSYAMKYGTSMSSPVAAGVAAVILSAADDLEAFSDKTGSDRVDTLYQVMRDGAIPCASEGTGAGMTYLPKVFGLETQTLGVLPALPTFSIADKTTINAEQALLHIESQTTLGVDIYYSLDGKTPVLKDGKVLYGEKYTAPISIGDQKTVTVKAIAVNLQAGRSSKVASATYTFAPAINQVQVTAANNTTHLLPGKTLNLKATPIPAYASVTSTEWSVFPENAGVTISKSGQVSVGKTAPSTTYTITATLTDISGQKQNATYDIAVANTDISIKSVGFSQKSLTIPTDKTYHTLPDLLKVLYTNGSAGTISDVTFVSSNPKVVSVSEDGILETHVPGTATIKAISNDGNKKTGSIKITVNRLAEELTLTGSEVLAPGKSISLTASVTPADTSNKKLVWSVDGTGVTVKNGKIKAASTAAGTYTITARTTDGSNLEATHTISILPESIKSIRMVKKLSLFTTKGSYNSPTSASLNAEITGGDNTAVKYTSSAPEVATVDETGTVTAHSSGKATITCTAMDGSNKKATCTITVSVPMSKLSIVAPSDNSGYVCVGSTLKLKAHIGTGYGLPQNTKIKWHPDEGDESLISVSSTGVVKPKALPKDSNREVAFVIAEAADGSGASAKYTVTIVRKVKKLNLFNISNSILPSYNLDNMQYYQIPYRVTLTAENGANIGYQKVTLSDYGANHPAFTLKPELPTTTKNSNQYLSAEDGIRVKITVKLEGCNKTASANVIVVKTADGKIRIY